jgi:SWI/SNF-related matrix-associated actin-dependent regulator of chromatin subfamily A3
VRSAEDQGKVRLAAQMRRIDPADVPESGKSRHSVTLNISTTQASQKRKATEEPSRASTSRVTFGQPPAASQSVEVIVIDDEPQSNDIVDELYCTLHTSVVGIRYYDGRRVHPFTLRLLTFWEGLVGPGEEVVLVREPNNQYDS